LQFGWFKLAARIGSFARLVFRGSRRSSALLVTEKSRIDWRILILDLTMLLPNTSLEPMPVIASVYNQRVWFRHGSVLGR
jgi:hypothetical protein